MHLPRSGAAALLLAVLVVLAGCTGTLIDARASPATVPTDAHEAAGYVHGNTTAVPLTYPVGAFGVTRDVTVTSYVSGYSKTVGEGPGDVAALLVVSTPDARVAGNSVNPFAHATNAQLTQRAFGLLDRAKGLAGTEYEDLGDVRELARAERTVLGESAELVTFGATATVDGRATDVRLHVLSVEHGDDVVVALGVHDARLDESGALAGMMERIEHEAAAN